MNLRDIQFIKDIALISSVSGQAAERSGLPMGTVRGTIVSVDDPEERGRVKVIFDAVDPNVPEVCGAGEYSTSRECEEPDPSHWIDASPAFKGKQPAGLVNSRVHIPVSNGQYQYAVLQDVLYDPQLLTESAQNKMTMPKNSSMTRLPLYPSGSLPKACEENHGCAVIELDGPMNSDWLCVCLRRNGNYIWVRHVDLQHGHAGQDSGVQGADSHGDAEDPVNEQSVWDYVFPTSDQTMSKSSVGGTNPRPNPYNNEATWNPPPS